MLFEKAREGFLDGSLDWDTQTFSAVLLDLGTTDVGVKAITDATNATPIVVTSAGHGFSNGDSVYIDGIVGNLAANGLWLVASQAANTFELTRPDGTDSVGSGAYSSGGYAVCLGPSAAGDFFDDFSAGLVNSKVNLTGNTKTAGVADANDVAFSLVSGATVEAVAIIRDTGADATSNMVVLVTGKHVVTVAADAAGAATTLWVEALGAGIPTATALTFSNGKAATLSSAAVKGARSLSVTALGDAITAGHRALAPATGAGLPFTPAGGTLNIAWATTGIFKL